MERDGMGWRGGWSKAKACKQGNEEEEREHNDGGVRTRRVRKEERKRARQGRGKRTSIEASTFESWPRSRG